MKLQEMVILIASIMNLALLANTSGDRLSNFNQRKQNIDEKEQSETEIITKIIDDFVDSKNRKSEMISLHNVESRIVDLRSMNYANVPMKQQSGQVNYKYIITMLKTRGLTWITITDLSKLVRNIDNKTLTTVIPSSQAITTALNVDTTLAPEETSEVTEQTILSTDPQVTDEITAGNIAVSDVTDSPAEIFSDAGPDIKPAALKREIRKKAQTSSTRIKTTKKLTTGKIKTTVRIGKYKQNPATTKRLNNKKITSTTTKLVKNNQLQWWETFILENRNTN